MGHAADPRLRSLVESAYKALTAGKLTDAEIDCRRALALDPGNSAALFVLGQLAYLAHQYDEAVALLQRALKGNRRNVEAHCTLGLALLALGRRDDALAAMSRARTLRPDFAAVHSNLGLAQKETGQLDEALTSFNRAIAIDPGYSEAYFGRALVALLRGDTRTTWRDHEWRVALRQRRPGYVFDPRRPDTQAPLPSSLLPIDLAGLRVLALGEQGLGDDLFFLRYAPVLKARGARLAFLGDAKLRPLLSRVAAIDEMASAERLPAPIDCVVAVGDLPLLATAADDAVPPGPLPLDPDPAAQSAARRRLATAGPAPYLGITWRAGAEPQAGARRVLRKELPVELLGRSVAGWPGTIIVLQRHPRPGEVEKFSLAAGAPAADFSGTNDNLEEMLALLSLIEDYAGVSNTNMHLRAGLARSARVLIPQPPEWRWTAAGERSPWFPGFALYREDGQSGWPRALERLRKDLLAAAGRP